MKARQTKLLSIFMMLAMIGFGAVYVGDVFADTDDTVQASFLLNATPTVSGVDLEDDSYSPTSTMNPGTTWYRLNFTIATSATIADILNATIYIYDFSAHTADYNGTAATGYDLVTFLWVEATDTWSLSDAGGFTEWTVDSTNSDDPGAASSATTFDFSLRFNVSRAATYDTDWTMSVHIWDDDGTPETDSANETGSNTVSQYFEISYSASSFSWGTVQPNSINNTHGALNVSIWSNAQWEVRINSTDFNATGESDVDVEGNNIIYWDQDGSGGGISQIIRNTIATLPTGSTWDNQAAMTTETALSRDVDILLNPGTLFNAGVGKTWSTWITLWIQANA